MHKLHVYINFLQVVKYSHVWKKVKQFDILRHCFMYPFVDCKLYHQQGATSNRCWHCSRQTYVPCDATASLWATRENGITRTTHICVLTRYIGDFLNPFLFIFLNEMLLCNIFRCIDINIQEPQILVVLWIFNLILCVEIFNTVIFMTFHVYL